MLPEVRFGSLGGRPKDGRRVAELEQPNAKEDLKQSVPNNFKVMTVAAGDRTAKPLEEAKHGMFSYFLMKGTESEADQSQYNKITARELHKYFHSNVV